MRAWSVRVHWSAAPDVTCPDTTTYPADTEDEAIDAAVSVMDGCRHRWAPARAVRAEIRPDGGSWRTVAAGYARSYL